MEQSTKTCPFCAEVILAAAVKCKHCGSDVSAAGAAKALVRYEPPAIPKMGWFARWMRASQFGYRNSRVVCRGCQLTGYVRTKIVKRKKGISGAKATGAILTGGLSLLATGLSRKETVTQCKCDACECGWDL